MSALDPNSSLADWQRHLAGLPDCSPDESLWLRLQAAHAGGGRSSGRAPQRRYPWAVGMAAAVLMAVVIWPLMRMGTTEGVVEGQSLRGAPTASRAVVDAGLLQLDADIERAYASGADEQEIASLLATRQRIALSLEGAAPVLVARL
jgi:hypothetical protein